MKKKIFSIFITVVAFALALSFTNSVKAATLPTVEDITNADTLHQAGTTPTVEQETNGDDITIIYSAASLKVIGGGTAGTASDGRPDGYAWLGIRVTAPTGISKYKIGGDIETDLPFDRYFGVNNERLRNAVINGKDITFTFSVDWLNDDETIASSNTIKVVIKADKITLYDKNNTDVIWDEDIAEEVKAEAKNENTESNDANTESDTSKKENAKKQEKDEKDETYKTGSANIVLGAFIVSIISLAGVYFIKK